MSVEFSNAYQEILLENLMSVIKQNFIFQTQLKMNENSGRQQDDLQNQFLEAKKQYDELLNSYNNAKRELEQIEIYKNKAEQNNTAHEEKSRIQSALNDEMKKFAVFKTEMENKEANLQKLLSEKEIEVKELKEYILRLEGIAPVTKLKKMSSPKSPEISEEKSEIPPKIENKLQVKVLDGSSF